MNRSKQRILRREFNAKIAKTQRTAELGLKNTKLGFDLVSVSPAQAGS
jgi:hypothetical protein